MSAKRITSTTKSRRGRVPANESEDRNARILDAATEVFLKAGFAGATMTAIAKQAGCSLETLYTAYPTKAQMFAALTVRKATGLFDAVGDLNADRDLREALTRFATEVLALMMKPDTSELHRLVIGESRAFPEVGETFWEEGPGLAVERMTAYFEAKRAGGAYSIVDPTRAAEVFLGLVCGVAAMRSNLGIRSVVDSRKQLAAWAEYSTNLFVALLEQGMM